MHLDSTDDTDLSEVFALAAGDPVAPATPDLLSAITSGGRRRRRINRLALAAPLAVVSAGVVVGGVALASSSTHHVGHLSLKTAASTKPTAKPAAKTAAAATTCDETSAQHYLVAAEIPANLGDRKDAIPTAAVPIEITWPGAAAGDPNFDFKVACSSATPTGGTSVNINGVTGSLTHTDPANLGQTSTIAWSPAPGFVVSYSSFGGSNGPVSDTALIDMARAVPTAS